LRALETDPHLQRHDVVMALVSDYADVLGDLLRAGIQMVFERREPSWFHAQRVLVAVARSRLARVDPARREADRKWEARYLLRLCDFANQRARTVRATTRPAKRERRRLESLPAAWREQADVLLHGEGN
jgi:hypothetical protein